jgi:hypothetical protein
MYTDVPENEREKDIAEIIIAKNRSGKCDTIKTKCVGSITSFLNLEKDANEMSLEESAPFDPKDIPPEENVNNESVSLDNEVDNNETEIVQSNNESLDVELKNDDEMEIKPLSEEDELLDIFE